MSSERGPSSKIEKEPTVWKIRKPLCGVYVREGYLYVVGTKTVSGRLGMVWIHENPISIQMGRGKTLTDYGGQFVMHHVDPRKGHEWWIIRAPARPLRGKYFKLFRRSENGDAFVTIAKLGKRGFAVLKDTARGQDRESF